MIPNSQSQRQRWTHLQAKYIASGRMSVFVVDMAVALYFPLNTCQICAPAVVRL